MKFFISHSSQNKPTIKAILEQMPLNIKTWIDEEQLVWGANLKPTFEDVIQKTDYVILFLSESAAKSAWVKQEVDWALEKEKATGRTILLPILIESGEENPVELFSFVKNRKYLTLSNFEDAGISRFAKEFSNYLFTFICNELSEAVAPSQSNFMRTVVDAKDILNIYLQKVKEIVFYHREGNPISMDELFTALNEKVEHPLDKDQFSFIVEDIISKGLLPGVYYDGYEMYLEEEHMLWKTEMFRDGKKAIAKKAATYIKSGMKIYLDAGSTIGELVTILCHLIEVNKLFNVTIATISISHANEIASCLVKKGLDQSNSNIRLLFVGGYIRPNTEATIPMDESDNAMEKYGPYDLAFIGVNGATAEGFTVLPNDEYRRKQEAYSFSKKRILMCDSSKCGIKLEGTIGKPDGDYLVIMDDLQNQEKAAEIREVMGEKMIYVKA